MGDTLTYHKCCPDPLSGGCPHIFAASHLPAGCFESLIQIPQNIVEIFHPY